MSERKTGLFYVKNPAGVVVMWQGQERARYPSVEAFVSTHLEGMAAIEKLEAIKADRLDDILSEHYTPEGPR